MQSQVFRELIVSTVVVFTPRGILSNVDILINEEIKKKYQIHLDISVFSKLFRK